MLYRVRGANSCTLHCGKGRPRSFVGWGTAPAFYRGGGGLRYVTTWEESAHVRHIAGWESDIVPCGKGVCGTTCVLCAVNRTGHVTVFVGGVGFIHGIVHGARCVTVWDEPTHTRYVVRGGPGSCTCVLYAQFDVYYDNAIVMSARAGA